MGIKSPLISIREDAKIEAEQLLHAIIPTQITPLGLEQINNYKSVNPFYGWRFNVDFDKQVKTIDFLLPPDFPFCVPRIALVKPLPEGEVWPHLEPNGLLCLPETEEAYTKNIADLTKEAIFKAIKLIGECSLGIFDPEELREEFSSYWNRQISPEAKPIKSLLKLEKPARQIFIWWGNTFSLVGETKEEVINWINNRYGKSQKDISEKVYPALFLWVPTPLLPVEYPDTNRDIFHLAKKIRGEASTILGDLTGQLPAKICVILGSQTKHGPIVAGLILSRPRNLKQTKANSRKFPYKGFRPGKVPKKLLKISYLSEGKKIYKASVTRMDSSWIHGRDQDLSHKQLKASKIAFIGCGSVGSEIIKFLAQTGIGNMILIDHDFLSHANTSRHLLGAEFTGRNKANALCEHIKKEFPHINEVKSKEQKWQNVELDEPELIRSCDLVISSVGSWRVENALNEIHIQDNKHPPVLYGWLEEHGLAGHALLINRKKACFHCGFHPDGQPLLKATSWPDGAPMVREPGCSAIFQPYGSIDVAPAIALIATTAIDFLLGKLKTTIHRAWLGDSFNLSSCGGKWDENWIAKVGNPGKGWCRIEREWKKDQNCIACSGGWAL